MGGTGTFFFIDGIRPDREAKRSMRSHVMRSKNAGKTFNSPSRVAQARSQPNRYDAAAAEAGRRGASTRPRNFGDPVMALWTQFTGTTIYHNGVIMDFMAHVSHHIYPVKLGFTLESYKHDWLRSILIDEATYQVHVGLMQACNHVFINNGHDSEKGLLHLSQGLVQVKKRLVGADALSDSTIGIVLALVLQEQMRRQGQAAQVHFDGLSRMIQLRGGLACLSGSVPLLLKVCKADIVLSLNHGMPTTFFRDEFACIRKDLDRDEHVNRGLAHNNPHGVDTCLNQVFHDAVYLSKVLALNARSPGIIDIFTFQEMLFSICYRALGFQPLQEARVMYDIQSAYQIGVIFFAMTLFLQYENRRSLLEFEAINRCFGEIVRWDIGVDDKEKDNHGVRFWCLIIGGMLAARNEEEKRWLVPRMRELTNVLGLDGWDAAKRVLRMFPWIEVIHDESGRKLWNEVVDQKGVGREDSDKGPVALHGFF